MPLQNYSQQAADYRRVEQAILYLERNFRHQPELKEIASSVGLSEYHFQRLFSRWAGISPKRFLQFLTIEHAKKLLAEPKSLLDVTYETGLSSPGRLHDLFVTCEAVTPGEFKTKGNGLVITYAFQPSPWGECLLSVTDRGICGLEFVRQGSDRDRAKTGLKNKWPGATFSQNPPQIYPFVEQIFAFSEPGNRLKLLDNARPQPASQPLPLFLKGTNFQLKVWQALLNISPGTVVSYNDLAASVGQPGAARAVGNAVARNPIGFIIPCHRVIRKVGSFGDYQWGTARKKALLGWEAAQRFSLGSSSEVVRY